MQQRHTDREVYFHELAQTSERYFIPYVERVVTLSSSARVLEVGCGEGGNLVPFARRGCAVTGVDRAAVRVAEAQSFFSAAGLDGHFEAADIFNWAAPAAPMTSSCFMTSWSMCPTRLACFVSCAV